MYEGYLAEEFSKTFCSAECLDKEFYVGLAQTISDTPEDEEDDLVIFWTQWDEEDEDEDEPCSQCGHAQECINCNPENYVEVPEKLAGTRVEGHRGTWYSIATQVYKLDGIMKQLYLMEHETYGNEAPCVIIDADSKLIMQGVYNGFDDLDYCLENDIAPIEYE
jgi:hypothetical protein